MVGRIGAIGDRPIVAVVLGVILLLPASALLGSFGASVAPRSDGRGVPLPTVSSAVDPAVRLDGPTPDHPSGAAPTPGAPEWINVTHPAPRSAPPATRAGSSAYDPLLGETVEFGGCIGSVCGTNQTWLYSGGTWQNVTDPRNAPPARYGATMDYDANSQGVLLFGGFGGASYRSDTWLYRGGAWTNVTPVAAVSPPTRVDATMSFDPEPEENGSVLFGGYEPGIGGWANDTWIWQGGSGWVLFSSSAPAPPPTGHAQMAYDPSDGAIVLFGCGFGTCPVSNQTWELYAGQWWLVRPPAPLPPYRADAAMTFDGALGEIVLFGGIGASGNINDTWSFAHGVWTKLATGPAPAPRSEAMISGDSSGSPPILFGGSGGRSNLNDTWVFEVPPPVALSASPSVGETSSLVTVSATGSGGTAPFYLLFAFGDGTTSLETGNTLDLSAVHGYLKAGVYDPTVNLTDAAGAAGQARVVPAVSITVGPSLAPFLRTGAGDVGVPIAFQAGSIRNGTGPFQYAWSFGDGGTSVGANTTHAFATAGTFSGNLSIRDSLGGSSGANFTYVIHPLPTLSVAASPRAPSAGQPAALYGNVTGGTPPYRYSWKFDDGSGSSVPSPLHTFASGGSHAIDVWVNDSLGAGSHARLNLTVGSASTPSNPSGPIQGSGGSTAAPAWFWPGVVGLVAVGIVGSILLGRRGRSASRSSPP